MDGGTGRVTLGSLGNRTGKQPPPADGDGKIAIKLLPDNTLMIASGEDAIIVTEYDAWALFGMLSLFIGVRLPKRLAERIHMGHAQLDSFKLQFGRDNHGSE
jgi:hypothetical protein